jgi:hypothetical protein
MRYVLDVYTILHPFFNIANIQIIQYGGKLFFHFAATKGAPDGGTCAARGLLATMAESHLF